MREIFSRGSVGGAAGNRGSNLEADGLHSNKLSLHSAPDSPVAVVMQFRPHKGPPREHRANPRRHWLLMTPAGALHERLKQERQSSKY